jgi:hypothetical protein
MALFAHPWSALLMCITGCTCLSTLGLTMSSVMKVRTEDVLLPKEKNDTAVGS